MLSKGVTALLLLLFTGLPVSGAEEDSIRITVLYNNVPCKAQLETGWGFSCLVEGLEEKILFDTGGDGQILLSNMEKLEIDPESVDHVVLSHIHGDHVGGLMGFLSENPDVTVYAPESFPSSFLNRIRTHSKSLVTVNGFGRLFENAYSTGEMGRGIKEQALVLNVTPGLIVISGCAHPGIHNMVEKARERLDRDVRLAMGGFHMTGMPEEEATEVIRSLKAMEVMEVAPSHCTGSAATALFEKAWGKNCISGGLGAVIEVPR